MPRFVCSILLLACSLVTVGCSSIPDGTEAVTGFDLQRYLGKWFEIARLDHSFERGLDCVTAHYSIREDGGVRVINQGVNLAHGEVKSAEGRAYFIGATDVGQLKVSFFGPFFGGYNVLALDDNYQWSLVAGPNRRYLWILARTPTLDEETYLALVTLAANMAFPVEELIRVNQGSACDSMRPAAQ